MVRTQIQLSEKQVIALKKLAAKRQESIASIIRQGVEIVLQSHPELNSTEKRNRAIAAAGRFHAREKDLATHHDKYLAEGYAK